ncbi:MAG: S8 family serine peptidase [Phormidesmis sp.]
MQRPIKRLFLKFICLGVLSAFLSSLLFLPAASSSHRAIAQSSPTADLSSSFSEGEYDSIVLDFSESSEAISQLSESLDLLRQSFNLQPQLNSEFSEADNVYIVSSSDTSLLETLRQSPLGDRTEFIEPNYIYKQSGFAVNDPDYAKQWNLQQINVEGAWRKGIRGKNVTVAVIDTGISQGPDLKQTKFVAGYDFVNDRVEADDDNGHGTHVAGTIAQSTNNRYGVAGIAYQAELMPLKVLSRIGSGTISDIAEAIRFAADNGADVINMSLGGGGESKLMREAIDYAHSKGVVVVAAAGNSSLSSASYPALYSNVIGVSAIGPDQQKTAYSNYGQGVEIAAPGGATRASEADGILQETINPGVAGEFLFKYFQGTSMAAPHVAGVAALIKSQSRSVSPERVLEILQTSATPVSGDSANHFGAGLLNAQKAVQMNVPVWLDFKGIDWSGMAMKLAGSAVFTGFLMWLLNIPRDRFNPLNKFFLSGVVLGSIGLFFIRIIHISSIPHWPLRILGSAIPEWGGAITNNGVLNPISASLLVPLGLLLLLASHPSLKWFSLGTAVGVTSFLGVSVVTSPAVWLIGSGQAAQAYLGVNALLCGLLATIFLRVAMDSDQTVE